jgi:hypothetical protein
MSNKRFVFYKLVACTFCLMITFQSQAQDRVCADGQRAYFGVCPEGDNKPKVPNRNDVPPQKYGQKIEGTQHLTNGDKYVGQLEDGQKSGQGTYTWAGGERYVGQWKNDLQSGQGTLNLRNGGVYVGQFSDGKQNGQGTYRSGDSEYVGRFEKGDFVYGEFKSSKGRYFGGMKNYQFNGQGTLTYPSGNVVSGAWQGGQLIRPQ